MKTKELKTFTIKRSKWARSDAPENGPSLLLNSKGNMCCLGFLSKKLGAPEGKLYGAATPAELVDRGLPMTKVQSLVRRNGARGGVFGPYNDDRATCVALMTVNDEPDIKGKDKEAKLTKLFAKIGWKPRFIN